jgi:hypothetical protein
LLHAELLQSDNYDIISSSESYIGNIDSDDYESADFKIYVKRTRDKRVQLPLRLEYRDSQNRQIKKDIIIQLPLYSASEAKKYGLIKSSNPIPGLIIFIVILALATYYLKKKKNIDLIRIIKEKAIELKNKFKR